jgi:fructose-1,6-bisphosphatase/sedoheptulose 1,7-bisphosphatase-like protein
MKFNQISSLRKVPEAIQGPIIITVKEGIDDEPKIIYFGERIGNIDSVNVYYYGDTYPITELMSGYLNNSYYVALSTEKFTMLFGNMPKNLGVDGRLFLQIIMNSGRTFKYFIK